MRLLGGGGRLRAPGAPPHMFLFHYIEKMIVRKGASMVFIIIRVSSRIFIKGGQT